MPHEGHNSFLQLNLQACFKKELNYSAASLLVFTLSSTNGITHHEFTCCVAEYHILFFNKNPKALKKVNNMRSNPSAAKLSAAGVNTHKHTYGLTLSYTAARVNPSVINYGCLGRSLHSLADLS